MATTVTVKGQVTIPKAVREAAGIRPGDRVAVRALPEGGVVVEKDTLKPVPDPLKVEACRRRVEKAIDDLYAGGFKPAMSADEMMRLLRDDD